jgi:hypothetical protein
MFASACLNQLKLIETNQSSLKLWRASETQKLKFCALRALGADHFIKNWTPFKKKSHRVCCWVDELIDEKLEKLVHTAWTSAHPSAPYSYIDNSISSRPFWPNLRRFVEKPSSRLHAFFRLSPASLISPKINQIHATALTAATHPGWLYPFAFLVN